LSVVFEFAAKDANCYNSGIESYDLAVGNVESLNLGYSKYLATVAYSFVSIVFLALRVSEWVIL